MQRRSGQRETSRRSVEQATTAHIHTRTYMYVEVKIIFQQLKKLESERRQMGNIFIFGIRKKIDRYVFYNQCFICPPNKFFS